MDYVLLCQVSTLPFFRGLLLPDFSHGVPTGAALDDSRHNATAQLTVLVDLQWPIIAGFWFFVFSLGPEKVYINPSLMVEALRGKT